MVVLQSCGDTDAATACAPSCHDGVRNGDEADIDCGGGICRACLTPDYAPSTLVAIDAAAGDEFGFAVAMDRDWIVAGSRLDDDRGPASGSVYLFDRSFSPPLFRTKLTAPDGGTDDQFGRAVAVCGGHLFVGTEDY